MADGSLWLYIIIGVLYAFVLIANVRGTQTAMDEAYKTPWKEISALFSGIWWHIKRVWSWWV